MKTPIRYFGPYLFNTGKNAGRHYMTVLYSDGSRGSTLYSRYLMQLSLGSIPQDRVVDHVNEDKGDDRVNNFQLLTRAENSAKSNRLRRPIKWYEFKCPMCGIETKRQLRHVKHNWKQGKGGPYCGKKCSRNAQLVKSGGVEISCGTNAKYARGCRCIECKKAHNFAINEWKKRKKCGGVVELAETTGLGPVI